MLESLRSNVIRTLWRTACMFALATATGGCGAFGWLAAGQTPAEIKPAYDGLKGETVAIWVYADEVEQMDFPHIQDDLAGAIQSHLKESEDEALETTRYQNLQKVADYQRNHPTLRGRPLTEFAGDLGVTRVVYVELRSFSTRSNASVDLFRGKGVADVHVVEVDLKKPGSAKETWKQENINAKYPEQGGEGENVGVFETPDINAQSVYVGTIQALGLEIAEQFYQHAPPDDELSSH